MAVLHLVTSLLVSALRLDLTPTRLDGNPLHLVSPTRNLTLALVATPSPHSDNESPEDSVLVAALEEGETVSLTLRCLTASSLQLATSHSSTVVHSHALCANASALVVEEEALFGCVSNIFQGNVQLHEDICSNLENEEQEDNEEKKQAARKSTSVDPNTTRQTVYVAEPLQLNEGGSMPLQWKNVYVFSDHNTNFNISNKDIIFSVQKLSVVEGPDHGELLLRGSPTSVFPYDALLGRAVVYKHDGSEVSSDRIHFQVEFPSFSETFPLLETATYSLEVRVNPVNDAPQLSVERARENLQIASKGTRLLTASDIILSDVDSGPDEVRVQIIEAKGVRVRLRDDNKTLEEFSQRQLISGDVLVEDNGSMEPALLKIVARDKEARSPLVLLHFSSVKVDVRVHVNTGIRLLHHESMLITRRNLSFVVQPPSSPLSFSIVELPDEGVIECSSRSGHFSLCSHFTQSTIDEGLLRYRHTGVSRPNTDSFSFQVESGDFVSQIQTFRITFIPISVKVFTRELFMLNATQELTLTRSHLFAWTFPKTFPASQLVYHIIEPPKLGILSKKVGWKQRRLGVSSNFTQEEIDTEEISYKLHYTQFSLANDYVLFRVLTPHVRSEELRLEIMIIPSQTSVQLINRTIVLHEGGSALITNDFLSLTTSDERLFNFVIGSLPTHGKLEMREGKEKRELGAGDTFSTKAINEHKLFYAHNGEESRTDQVYLIAEGINRKGTRIPFWLSLSVILQNDNPPVQHGSREVYLMERGERLLRRSLLDWRDEDIDASPLSFHFTRTSKEAAILSSISPHLPINSSYEQDLDNGKIIIRHLGISSNFSLKYVVNDGEHSVEGEMLVYTSQPFAAILNSAAEHCCTQEDTQEIPISRHNLSVATNLDVDSTDIVYKTKSLHFFLKQNSGRQPVQNFTQKEINDDRLMYVAHGVKSELLTVTVGQRKLQAELRLTLRSSPALQLRRASPLSVPVGGAMAIDSSLLSQGDGGQTPADKLFYIIQKMPAEGQIFVEGFGNANAPLSSQASVFSQDQVDSGSVQYVHTGSSAGKDSFHFNISSPTTLKGPYTFYVEIYERHVSTISLSAAESIIVTTGTATVLSPSILKVTSSEKEDFKVHVDNAPRYGFIVRDTWNLGNITSIRSFTGSEMHSRRIFIVGPKDLQGNTGNTDSVTFSACLSDVKTCTPPTSLHIKYSKRNIHSPQVIRNEVLRVLREPSAIISNIHLSSEDPDTPSDQVQYLISRPASGIVARSIEPSTPIYAFSQADIDDGLISFFTRPNSSTTSAGFSFLLTDGVHQIGPEWFAIESRSRFSVALEANSRLTSSPQSAALINADLLRANIDNATPEEIIFSVSRPPKHGKIIVNGAYSYRFSQAEINRRLVFYSSVNSTQQSVWTVKDAFHFHISINGSNQPIEKEHRFRITQTYAALRREHLYSYVSTQRMYVSSGGSTACNISHFSLSKLAMVLESDALLFELARKPRYGDVDSIDGRTKWSWEEFERGHPIVYRHTGEGGDTDEAFFYVYPQSESTRGSSRLRVSIPVLIHSVRDPLVQVSRFPFSVSIVAGGVTALSPEQFSATHPQVPAQSLLYELIQAPRGKLSLRVDGRQKAAFTQEDVRSGIVSLWHTASAGASNADSLVFLIEGHTRALFVKVRPLDLSLENQTTISYQQGKSYVVLNRKHLGAYSANRSKVTYRIVNGPKNGTLYWVAGEKEAKRFTQSDIDEGRVLYAQLNMKAYQDRFEFALGDGERELLRSTAEVRVLSLIDVQPIIVEALTATQITASQLNASRLQGLTPRFLVMEPLKYGTIAIEAFEGETTTTAQKHDSNKADSTAVELFFTYTDVLHGRLFYQSRDVINERFAWETSFIFFDLMHSIVIDFSIVFGESDGIWMWASIFHFISLVVEEVLLQVMADDMQPALVTLSITVLPGDADASGSFDDKTPIVYVTTSTTISPEDAAAVPRLSPVNDHLIYIILILLAVLLSTVICLSCRLRNSTKKATITTENNSSASLPLQTNLPAVVPTPRRPDLLGSTVFATISRAEAEARPAMKSFDKVPPEIPPAGTQPIEQPLHRQSLGAMRTSSMPRRVTPLRPQPSLDYAAMSVDTPPPMALYQQIYSENAEVFDV